MDAKLFCNIVSKTGNNSVKMSHAFHQACKTLLWENSQQGSDSHRNLLRVNFAFNSTQILEMAAIKISWITFQEFDQYSSIV